MCKANLAKRILREINLKMKANAKKLGGRRSKSLETGWLDGGWATKPTDE